MESPCQVLRHGRQGVLQPATLHGNAWAQGTERLMCLPYPPGHEGRAGMAALVLRPPQALNLVRLYTHVSENLPPYAWPRFLRLQVTSDLCPSPSPMYLQLLVVLVLFCFSRQDFSV